jgi:hypothetical protein
MGLFNVRKNNKTYVIITIFEGIGMNLVFNLIDPNDQVSTGLVEIFQNYDGNYFKIALDGKFINECYKQSYVPTVISRKFIRECCQKSEKSEDELVFAYYNFYGFGNDVDNSFDTNDYETYEEKYDFIKQNLNNQKAIKNFYDKYVDYVVVGIDELEDNIV